MTDTVDVVVGIDVGLTAVKVAAFSATGELCVLAHRATPAVSRPGGVHEVDMTLLWEAVVAALREVMEVAAGRWRVTSVGVTGHGNGLYPIDDAGRPVRAAITSSDTRAAEAVRAMTDDTRKLLRDATGCEPWPGQPLVLLSWLATNEPVAFASTANVLGCKDWVRFCLTGTAAADRTDASASGLLAGGQGEYAAAAFRLLGLPEQAGKTLPPLLDPDELAGHITPAAAAQTMLPAGVPVVAGCMDCVAGVIAGGGVDSGDSTLIVGTWAVTAVVAPRVDALHEIFMAVPMPGDADRLLYLNSAPAAGAAVDWVLETLGLTYADAFAAAATVPAGSDGLVFLPFLHGLPGHPSATGSFLGVQAHHGNAHLVRAALEGVAQYYRVQLRTHERSGATPSGRCRLIGGGARSAVWAQIFADVLDRPVERVEGDELGARGAALLAFAAAEGSGWRPSATRGGAITGHHDPGDDRIAYARQAAVFDRWFAAAVQVWNSTEESP